MVDLNENNRDDSADTSDGTPDKIVINDASNEVAVAVIADVDDVIYNADDNAVDEMDKSSAICAKFFAALTIIFNLLK